VDICFFIAWGSNTTIVTPRKLDATKPKEFIEAYEKLLNRLGPDDEAVLFVDAVHPTHAARPVGCWARRAAKLAIEQTSGRQHINIHGAINLETGQTRMIDIETIDVLSTIRLLESSRQCTLSSRQADAEWLSRPSCRIKLHLIPSYCPHLNPIERL
jgi:hypothetical protein